MCVTLHPYGTKTVVQTDVYEKNIVFRLHHAYMAKHSCNSKDTCGVL